MFESRVDSLRKEIFQILERRIALGHEGCSDLHGTIKLTKVYPALGVTRARYPHKKKKAPFYQLVIDCRALEPYCTQGTARYKWFQHEDAHECLHRAEKYVYAQARLLGESLDVEEKKSTSI
jgi:hypothetical protein|tara:strand:- start:166 stop:531 length:366 start_codon:yes stop_codon:yes gene_type:complete